MVASVAFGGERRSDHVGIIVGEFEDLFTASDALGVLCFADQTIPVLVF